ncbi:MAG: Bug family tripartite tricarboxylate transporter substrate binding protein [Burkholderiaceae bacterium]
MLRPLFACLLSLLTASVPAVAQEFPTKPVRLVVPWPTGGSADIVTRIIGQKLQEVWKQPVIIDNRGGASGNIGGEFVARSAPDGYTLMYGAMSSHAMNQWLFPKMTFDPVKDFTPITIMANNTTVLLVPASSPVNSVSDLIARAKANPGKLNYASIGNGSFSHLAGILFLRSASLDAVHVPYKGGNPALIDLAAGQVDFLFIGSASATSYVKEGRLKLLATAGAKRSSGFPNVPTVAETVPNFELSVWNGILGPAGMPKPLVDRINRDIRRVLEMPDVRSRLTDLGAEVVGSSPEEFGAQMRADAATWQKIIRDAGIKLE